MHQQQRRHDKGLLRLGALTAVAGVTAALVQSALDPALPDDPVEAIRQASTSHALTASRVLDLAAFLLMLVGVSVIVRMFSAGRGGPWARMALVFFAVSAGAGAIATSVVGALPDVAQAWAEAPPVRQPGYVAAFDALTNVSGGIFSVSWVALGAFGLLFAVALSKSGFQRRSLVWISAASGVASIAAVVGGVALQLSLAFPLLILGLLLSYIVIVTTGLQLWRLSRRSDETYDDKDRLEGVRT